MNNNHPEPSAPRGVAERMAPHRVSDVAQTSPAGAPDRKQSQVASSSEPEAWPEAVDGANLLCSLSEWLRSYVWMRTEEADAIALWVVATWIVEGLYIAPILAVLSATKRCGKTTLRDLLRGVVRRPMVTSGVGITPAVLFRLNSLRRPTFLIDEAEKLGGRHADKELVSLLNDGYRQGATVARCAPSTFEIQEFDAFGFRALFAIGSLWDTVIDRAIVIRLRRKPKDANVVRFNARLIEREGSEFASKIRRWAADNGRAIAKAEARTAPPSWLADRACDNWAALFGVADVAGTAWPERAYAAARVLSSSREEDGDRGEQLIHDLRDIFQDADNPEAIQSGKLCEKLNAIETSPWGDYRGERGMSTQKLASMLKEFEVRPRQNRTPEGRKVRGYWLQDLRPVFERYPSSPPAELGHVGQSSHSGRFERPTSDFPSGTDSGLAQFADGKWDRETPRQTCHVPIVPLPAPPPKKTAGHGIGARNQVGGTMSGVAARPLSELESLGVSLRANGDGLYYLGPDAVLTFRLRESIGERKDALVSLLEERVDTSEPTEREPLTRQAVPDGLGLVPLSPGMPSTTAFSDAKPATPYQIQRLRQLAQFDELPEAAIEYVAERIQEGLSQKAAYDLIGALGDRIAWERRRHE